jgi:MoxR-like ATPase
MKLNESAKSTLDKLFTNGEKPFFGTTAINEAGRACGLKYKEIQKTFMTDALKVGYGKYDLRSLFKIRMTGPFSPEQQNCDSADTAPAPVFNMSIPAPAKITAFTNDDVYVPSVDPTFVAWGEHASIKKVIQSRMFFPVYISGLSGNGKTMMVEQACAKLKREYIRVQISPETDEDDLIGGFRLVNGETVFHKGPVVKAMERGCILLIDEIDRGSNKIMCLQGVLEGKPILIKKIGEVVAPAPGFNIIATANTKGRGSDDGRYSAASIIDDAFMERFVATIDQPYPNFKTEHNIVKKHLDALDIKDDEFVDKLVGWSAVIRKTYEAEGVDELISTRRLCHIVKAYSVFNDRLTAINMCISRFENETREAFLDLYTKIDGNAIQLNEDGAIVQPPAAEVVPDEEVPF